MKIYRMKSMLENSQVSDFTLTHTTEESETPVVIFQGSDVVNELYNYGERFTTRNVVFLWTCFKKLFWEAYYKQFELLTKNIDVINTFDITDKGYNTKISGDIDNTRIPDETQNYTKIETEYDYTKEVEAGTGDNKPKQTTYDLSYNTSPKEATRTETSGKTFENSKTNQGENGINKNYVKNIDNLRIVNREHHSVIDHTVTATGENVSGDEITTYKHNKSGYENENIPDTLKNAIEFYKTSILNEMIQHFIAKYTFYVGGENYDIEFVADN